MKANRWFPLLVPMLFAFIALTAWTGCERKPTESAGAAAATKPSAPPAPIRIGAILSLTGPMAPYGQNAKRGMDLAVAEVNRDGGVGGRPLEVLFEDAQSEPRAATLAARKLIHQDKVPAVIGFIGSSLLLASAPIFNENHVVLVSPGASSPEIRDAGEYVFRTRASGRLEAHALADYATKKLECGRIAILYVNNEYGTSWRDTFVSRTEATDGQIGIVEAFAQGATNLRTQLSKIKASSPGCVLILGYFDEIVLAIRQARELDLTSTILTTVGIQDERVFDMLGSDAEGVLFCAVDYDPTQNEASKRFDEAYQAAYGRSSDIFAANAYDAVHLICDGIAKRSATGKEIKAYLLSLGDYPGAGGTLRFDDAGDEVKPVSMKKIENRRFSPIN